MTTESTPTPLPPYCFEMSTDGCDEVLTVYRLKPRRRRLAAIHYWTGAGVAMGLSPLLTKEPGLRAACQRILELFVEELASPDPVVRSAAERERELIAGLRLSLEGPTVPQTA
jgi:hypothetical protein